MNARSWRQMATEELTEVVVESEQPIMVPVVIKDLKQIVEPRIKLGRFAIRYVQPDPVPQEIELLQKLGDEGLDLVKIPINKKEDKIYMRGPIHTLLNVTGIHWDKITDLVNDYNNDELMKNREHIRVALLNLVDLAIYYCDKEGIEFLRE
jgi:hypothetical protein